MSNAGGIGIGLEKIWMMQLICIISVALVTTPAYGTSALGGASASSAKGSVMGYYTGGLSNFLIGPDQKI